jgi:hypothetical protein
MARINRHIDDSGKAPWSFEAGLSRG